MFLRQAETKKTDEALIGEFRSSEDSSILGSLFSRYSAMVYGVCLKYLHDRDEAKDAVMQIFEKLPKSLKEHQIQHFKSWLYTTTRNHCLMKLRTSKGKYHESIDDVGVENASFMHLEVDAENLEVDLTRLERCIEELKDEQKDCVKMFFLKQLCYKDISTKTGMELNKVKSHIQNGKRNLKICMEQSG